MNFKFFKESSKEEQDPLVKKRDRASSRVEKVTEDFEKSLRDLEIAMARLSAHDD